MDKPRIGLFLVLSILVLILAFLQQAYFPEKPKPAAEEAEAKDAESKPVKEPGKPVDPAQVVQPVPAVQPEIRSIPPAEKDELLALGDDSYKLKVILSTQGGAVRKVTLPYHHDANDKTAAHGEGQLTLLNDELDGPLDKLPDHDRLERQSFRFVVPGVKFIAWERDGDPGRDDNGTINQVTFKAEIPAKGVRVRRTFQLNPDQYHIETKLAFEFSGSAEKAGFNYELTGPRGMPVEGQIWKRMPYRYVVIGTTDPKESRIAYRYMVSPSELDKDRGNPELNNPKSLRSRMDAPNQGFGAFPQSLQYAGVMLQYFSALTLVKGDPTKSPIESFKADYQGPDRCYIRVDSLGKDSAKVAHLLRELYGLTSDDELRAILQGWTHPPISHAGQEAEAHRAMLEAAGAKVSFAPYYYNQKFRDLMGQASITLGSRTVLSDEEPHEYLHYIGPNKVRLLAHEPGMEQSTVSQYEREYHLANLTDYTWHPFWQTTGLTWLFVSCTNIMHELLEMLRALFSFLPGPYGFAIVVITVIVRAMMFPVSLRQANTQNKMAALQPELEKLKKKYPNDKEAYNRAMMDLYRDHGISPAGGCLPILVQMPIFMGLYYALQESTNLRLANALWMSNLAAPDMLLNWGDWAFSLSYATAGWIDPGPYLHLLPIVSGILMYVSQKLYAPPAITEEQQIQMQTMNTMTLFMIYAFYWVPSGLCIYFIVSSLWGMIERQFMPKKPKDGVLLPPKPTTPHSPSTGKKGGQYTNNPKPGFFQRVREMVEKIQAEADKKK